MKKAILVFCCISLASCIGISKPSNFYALQVENNMPVVSNIKTTIGVEPVRIPDYLDKPQMVTRQENGVKLDLSETNRWSEPLDVMMQRAIAADMALLLPKSVVKARMSGREMFTYKVFIEINRFEGNLKGREVVLDAWWYIFDNSGNQVVRKNTILNAPANGGYDAVVLAQSRLVGQLSEQIALAISKIK